MHLEKALNITFSIVLFLIILIYFLKLDTHLFFKILKLGLEASLIGFIADSYAVYGLFYKIGPHTNLILNKRKNIEERIIKFVSEFLISKEFLEKELEKVDLKHILDNLKNEKTKEKFADFLIEILNKSISDKKDFDLFKEHPLGAFIKSSVKDILVNFLLKYFKEIVPDLVEKIFEKLDNNENLKEDINKLLKENISKLILDNYNNLVLSIENKIKSISDEDFLNTIKRLTWQELQWIRLNGAIIGFLVGIILGIIESF